ncbi:DDE-type integrase/transposase/recombinase [Bogoriella caseilytica]|uniref:DDE-type integrase/transposase/recombinase n=1 Tax=Bogoriella caseilytica TaxID=56055 RepID=UPI000F492540|nr:DDE-type integrase/transposase/recombinase [Bogoriella caseilytica]
MTNRQLYRHIAAYRAEGVAGLVDKRRLRTSIPGRRADPLVVQLLEEEVAGQTNLSTGTRHRAITRVIIAARKQGVPVPSRATLYRILAVIERDRRPFGKATTRRTQANRPDRTYGRQSPARPGELVEIDSTPLDVLALYQDGSTGRPELTVALDIATRVPLAAILRPKAAKGVDAAMLLARAMTPLAMQPGWDAELSYAASHLPPGALPHDAYAQAAAKPVIVPETVTVDRGKVFVGQAFMHAAERLGTSVIKAAYRTPTDKPHIERFFHLVDTGFTQYLDGYTGSNGVTGAGPYRPPPDPPLLHRTSDRPERADRGPLPESRARPDHAHPHLSHREACRRACCGTS